MTRRARVLVLVTSLTALGGIAAGATGGLVASGVVAFSRSAESSDSLPLASVLKAGNSRRVADFTNEGNSDRAVYVARTSDNQMVCLWDTNLRTGHQGGGCNYANDVFGQGRMMVSFSFDGGPAVEDISEARVIGIVDPAVARVEILQSNGQLADVALTADRAFAVAFRQSDILGGRAPAAVIARDSDGTEIDREPIKLG